jgi:hypothetical protein
VKKKWQAQIYHNKKMTGAGIFDNEKDAAKAVNFKCRELKIPMKNSEVGVLDYKILQKVTKVIRFFIFHFDFLFFFSKR